MLQIDTVTITILVPNIPEVLRTFDRVRVFRSTTGVDGPFTEVSSPSTRVALEAGVQLYRYTDVTGNDAYYYRISFISSLTGAESAQSAAELGNSDGALDVLSTEELKAIYLFGVDLTNDFGEPFSELMFQHGIRQAVSWLEHRLDLPIRRTVIEDERHDFYIQEWSKYCWLQLDKYPVISIESIRMVLPTDQNVITFRPEWIQVQKDVGQINILPGTGAESISSNGTWSQYARGGADFLPDVIRVSYVAGFEPGKVPDIIKEAVGKLASFGPLNIAGDLIGGAGIASKSISMDGLSQSISTTSSATNAGYGSRLIQYQKEIKEIIPTLRRYYHGQRMSVA